MSPQIVILVDSNMLDLRASEIRDVVDCTVIPPHAILIDANEESRIRIFPGMPAHVSAHLHTIFGTNTTCAPFFTRSMGDLHLNVCSRSDTSSLSAPWVLFCGRKKGTHYILTDLPKFKNGSHIAAAARSFLTAVPGIAPS